METAFARVESLARRHGAANVLLVLDLDNTLLASERELGSDQWFEWQRSLAAGDSRRVAPDFEGLIEEQTLLHRQGSMRLTEPGLPRRLRELQDRGVRALVLTARGADVSLSTLRELDRQDLDFRLSAPGPVGGWRDVFRPWPGARAALYWRGVYMVAGQDKGRALRVLLERLDAHPAAIVFVDDKAKNVAEFADDFTGVTPETWLYRYGGEDDVVARFKAAPGVAVDQRAAMRSLRLRSR